MKRIRYNGNTLLMYDSIDEMPITRFQEYNRFLLINSGIGSDATTISQHIDRIDTYIAKHDNDKAQKELTNYKQNLLFVIERTSPEMSAFAALVKSVNGNPYDDLSNEGVKELLAKISSKGVTVGKVWSFLEEVKKKLIQSLPFISRTQVKMAAN